MPSPGLHGLTSSQHLGSEDFGQEVLAVALFSTNGEEKAILKVANFYDLNCFWQRAVLGCMGGSELLASVLLGRVPAFVYRGQNMI